MRMLRFKIGDAFPAGDPVARFVTVLGMMSNDWVRLPGDLVAVRDSDRDAEAQRVSNFRQQAAIHHEAAEFIRKARQRFPEIGDFLDRLDAEAHAEQGQILGGVDPKSPHYLGDWLEAHRNVTFHYPEMHRRRRMGRRKSTRP